MSRNNISTVIKAANKTITISKTASPELVKKIMIGLERAKK